MSHFVELTAKMGTGHRWQAAKRLLCVRLDTLGDVLMTGPAIRALKASRPGRHVTLLTSPAGAEAGRLIPDIDDISVYEAPWMKATGDGRAPTADLAAIEQLRAGRYDAAVIFTVYSQNPLPAALLTYLAGIPLRLAHCRENPYHLLTDWIRELEPETCVRHEVRRQLDLVGAVGAYTEDERLSIRIPPEAAMLVDDMLSRMVGDAQPWIAIHPGATAASRRYPPEGFAAVAGQLIRELGCDVIFTGTAGESSLIEGIQRLVDGSTHSLAGKLDVAAFAALLARAPLLLSNNTGAVHVAAAVGTPVIDLYALTNPQHTPWRVPHRVLFHDVPCKYCYKSVCPEGHHDCLRRVDPSAIAKAVGELLEETAGRHDMRLPLVHPRH